MKNVFKILGVIALAAVIGFGFVSCGGGGGGGGGDGVPLPKNLKNTKWKNGDGYGIEFSEKTFKKYGQWGAGEMTCFSAKENGKITGKLGSSNVWDYMDEETICTSYTITGNTIVFVGSDTPSWDKLLEGTWTKESSGTGGGDKTISYIYVNPSPTKTTYRVGETLDTTGMVVTAYYDDYTDGVITDYTMELEDGTAIKHGDTISLTPKDYYHITIKKGDINSYFSINIKAAIPSSAEVGITVNAKASVKSYPNPLYHDYINTVTITLTLPDGGEWIRPNGGFTDEQEEAIKSWVSMTSTGTSPAVSTWDFYVSVSGNKLLLTYDKSEDSTMGSNPVTAKGTVTASIVQEKVSEMKPYTNITGTVTASTETASDSNWSN